MPSTVRSAWPWIACLAALLLAPPVARGQTAQGAAADVPARDSLTVDSTASVSPSATFAMQPRDYLAEIRARFSKENRSYSNIKTILRFVSPLYGILVGVLILFSGLSAKLRDIAHNMGKRRYVRVLVFFVLYTLLGFVLAFPLSWYDGFAIEHQFQLSNQTFGGWIHDELIGLMVGVIFFGVVPLLALAYVAIEKSPRRWWLWLALGTIPVIIVGTLITPLVIDPLTNKFTPLRDQELKGEILALAAKANIPGRNVYEVDKSAQTNKYNAYVNGFGASQRIVLWDTTLKGMTRDEILYVMGHEMGHYVLGHIWKGIAFFSGLSLVLFFLSARIMRWATDRFGKAWGFTELHDVASLPLLLTTLNIIVFLVQPVIHGYTRGIETQADVFGLEITHDNDAAARAFVKLGSQNKTNPEPSAFVRTWLYSHPPDAERVKLALNYKPWEQAKPNRYFKGGS
jgi:Zn-dependent protease with chaperone function